jgi:hypothetical protein
VEKQNYIVFIWLGLAYLWMVGVKAFVPETDPAFPYLGMGGMVFLIGGIMVQEVVATLKVAEARHLAPVIQPENRVRHIYYKRANSFETKIPNRYWTELELKMPFLHREYGKVEKIFVVHDGPWDERLKLREGKAAYWGMIVDHAHTDHPYWIEVDHPHIERSKRYPVYFMVTGAGDHPDKMTVEELWAVKEETAIEA